VNYLLLQQERWRAEPYFKNSIKNKAPLAEQDNAIAPQPGAK
jgi:hypothetical protein